MVSKNALEGWVIMNINFYFNPVPLSKIIFKEQHSSTLKFTKSLKQPVSRFDSCQAAETSPIKA